MAKGVKITVLRKLIFDDIIQQYSDKPVVICNKFEENQVFYTDGRKVPDGFCTWAWSDIFKDILLVRQNAECGGLGGKAQVVTCTDGYRPVVFLIEPHD